MYKRAIIDKIKFDIEEIAYRYSLLDIIMNGKVLLCDELEAGLHESSDIGYI